MPPLLPSLTAAAVCAHGTPLIKSFPFSSPFAFPFSVHARSGHGAFWTMGPLVYQAYYPYRGTTALMWVALVQTSIRDVLEKQHYSVDMLLAPVVTAAMWTWLAWVYPPSQPLPKRQEGAAADQLNPFVMGIITCSLAVAAIVVFVAKA